jgi:alkylhydroperoxidase/carboxymuconolactone decarboxylase family protein YurZ
MATALRGALSTHAILLKLPGVHADNAVLGAVWERPRFSKPGRSLVTVSARIAMNRAGWPNALMAIAVAKEIFE